MLPVTKAVPKELLPVAGKPLIQYAVEEAVAAGIRRFVIVIRNRDSLIARYFSRDVQLEPWLRERHRTPALEGLNWLIDTVEMRYVTQLEPLGLGHAIQCARGELGDECFAILLPDVIVTSTVPAIGQLIARYRQEGESLVAVRQVADEELNTHGVIEVDNSSYEDPEKPIPVLGLVEKPPVNQAPSRLGVSGRYLLQPSIWEELERTPYDEDGELQLTGALHRLAQKGLLYAVPLQGQHYDAGGHFGYIRANLDLSFAEKGSFSFPLLGGECKGPSSQPHPSGGEVTSPADSGTALRLF